jgi:hypothetical protein
MTLAGLGDRRVGDLLARMRHDGCGGRPVFAEPARLQAGAADRADGTRRALIRSSASRGRRRNPDGRGQVPWVSHAWGTAPFMALGASPWWR